MDGLSKVITLIMVVVMITLFPLQYLLDHQRTLLNDHVEHETVQLVKEMRDNQYLDVEMYEEFQQKLSVTGLLCDIEIEHAVPKEGADTASINDIPGVLVASNNLQSIPVSSVEKKTDTPERTSEISSFAAHTHTDACYDGHRHGESGCTRVYPSPLYGPTINLYLTYQSVTYNDGSGSWNSYYINCSTCGNAAATLRLQTQPYGWPDTAQLIFSQVYATSGGDYGTKTKIIKNKIYDASNNVIQNPEWDYYMNLRAAVSSSYVSNVINKDALYQLGYLDKYSCERCIREGRLSWSYGTRYSCDSEEDTTPVCDQVITGISPISPFQTVNVGQSVDARVGVNYLDGHSAFTTASIENFNTNAPGTQTVTLRVNGLVDKAKTYGSKSCTISVTVVNSAKQCTAGKGHPDYRNTLSACPICIALEKVSANNYSVNYDGTAKQMPINNSSGEQLAVFYDTDPGGGVTWSMGVGPTQVGTYPVHIYLYMYNDITGTWNYWFVMERNITINPVAISITANMTKTSINQGEAFPIASVALNYNNNTSTIVYSGWTITGFNTYTSGAQNVTVSYGGFSTTVTINVNKVLSSITVNPSSIIMERYTPIASKVTVTAQYTDGTSSIIHDYSVSGLNTGSIGSQTATITYTVNGVTKSAAISVLVTPMKRTCSECGTVYELDANDFDNGCPVCKTAVVSIKAAPGFIDVCQGDPLSITVTATFGDGHTEVVSGWNSNYDPNTVGFQIVMVSYLGQYDFVNVNVKSAMVCSICETRYALNEDGSNPGCPVCRIALMSITASPTAQTVHQGEGLSLTVYGVYRDGHSAPVAGWSSSFENKRAGMQQVTVYYQNLSCIVTVNVISEHSVQCSICGTVYDANENPWGCPVCMNTLVGITAALKNGRNKVAYCNTLELKVILTYRDGHRVMAFDGWLDNFNPYLLDMQTVTVSYTDKFGNTVSCSLNIEVVERLLEKICDNGHVYYPDHEDEPCPYCEAAEGVKALELYNCTYTDEILDKLYADGIYRFQKGDYITVTIKIKVKGTIYSFRLFGKEKEEVPISYGGEVS